MSYILDALRKSEQQRQAVEPETVTDRLLVNQPQTKEKSKTWIIALLIGNLLVITCLAWFFTKKTSIEPRQGNIASLKKQVLPIPVTPEHKVIQKPTQSSPKQLEIETNLPSIAELVDGKKIPDVQTLQGTKPDPNKTEQEKKPLQAKNEQVRPVRSNQQVRVDPSQITTEKPATPPLKNAIADINDLPYETRNTLPNLTINVFSYAQLPEDRFVIIDMVKYRTGQLIKGSVKLKEIRPDSIVVQYGNETFKVERP
jgi:general secretion pathway protein B